MRKALLILSIMVTASLLNTTAFASVNDDQVTSQKIKEADGTSGQNTNAGSGVKTGHIQDSAVTTGKIANGAVTDAKITGPISGSKLGTHSHNGSDIVDGTLTTTKIQDGAVTDAKITGLISASKISSSGLNADTVDGQHASAFAPVSHIHSMASVSGLQASLAGKSDVTHNHDTLYQQKYGKVAVVAQTGGDYTSPVSAMGDIAAWCGAPSFANPCIVKIMPGTYDLGSRPAQGSPLVQMQPFVDIEGSGENTTFLRGNAQTGAIVGGANNSSLRSLTVENENGGLYSSAIENNSASPAIQQVTAISTNGTEFGIWNTLSTAILTDVTVKGSQWGIYNVRSATTMVNVSVTAEGVGVDEYSSSSMFFNLRTSGDVAFNVVGSSMWGDARPVIHNSRLIATTTGPDSLSLYNTSGTVSIHGSILKGKLLNWTSWGRGHLGDVVAI